MLIQKQSRNGKKKKNARVEGYMKIKEIKKLKKVGNIGGFVNM